MAERVNAILTAWGGDGQYHYAHFNLEFDGVKARIAFEIEGPGPSRTNLLPVYRGLLRRMGAVAQSAAVSANALHLRDR